MPYEATRYCDAVCIGEGELHWHNILRDAQAGQLKTFYGDLSQTFDMADSVMPAYELLDLSKYNRLTVQTSRGCPHHCEFCASSILFANGRYRQKPMEKVLAEIDKICALWKRPFIEFADDNSFVNKTYWKQLLPELAKRHIRWFTETDISVAEDDELLDLMRQSGCAQVLIGLESPSPNALNGVEICNNWKLKRLKDYKANIQKIQDHGISVNGCFVLGLDGQGPECFSEVLDFAQYAELAEVQVTLQTAFPGTPLYHRLAEAYRLIEPTNWKKCTLFDVNFVPTDMRPEELTAGFRELVVNLYSDEMTQWRKDVFKTHLRNAHQKQACSV